MTANKTFASASKLFAALSEDADFLSQTHLACERIASALSEGNSVLIAGNGGSAAEAQHFSAEIVGRFHRERRGYPAIALTTDTSVLTAVGNDYEFRSIFARQVEALGRPRDVFIGLSTSGNSENVVVAFQTARDRGLSTISFLGNGGGKMRGMAEIEIVVPSKETARIQEAHLCIIHSICEELDARLS